MPGVNQAPYNSAQQCLALVQDLCNDPQGQLYTATFCLQALNSAARWIGRELRNRDKMTFVEDEYVVTIPAVTESDPMQQVNLTYTGINGNVTADNDPILPDDMIEPLKLWERVANMKTEPLPMKNWTGKGGLPKRFQRERLTDWEWRTDMICFIGALQPTQVMIRYSAVPLIFALNPNDETLLTGNLGDIDAMDACAYYASAQLLPKHGGLEMGKTYKAEADILLEQLATDVSRQQQFSPVRMRPYGGSGRGRYY